MFWIGLSKAPYFLSLFLTNIWSNSEIVLFLVWGRKNLEKIAPNKFIPEMTKKIPPNPIASVTKG